MENENNLDYLNIGEVEPGSGISSSMLRILACLFMLIDHIGYGIFEKLLVLTRDPDIFNKALKIDRVLRIVGRLAFPIFCYQLVVGFFYTRSRKKYAIRLFIFSLISEIPFNLMARDAFFDFSYQNVGFTLLLGFLAIWACEAAGEFCKKRMARHTYQSNYSSGDTEDSFNADIRLLALKLLTIVPFMVMAEFLHTDYSSKGVLLIALIYLFFDDQLKMACIAPSVFLAYYFIAHLVFEGNLDNAIYFTTNEMAMILSFILILKDNRKRNKSTLFKVFGYSFYPVHMLIIFLVSLFVLPM